MNRAMDNSFPHKHSQLAGVGLAACFLRPRQALWVEDKWNCPHCSELNGEATVVCGCGFSREHLADFGDHEVFSVAKLVIVLAL